MFNSFSILLKFFPLFLIHLSTNIIITINQDTPVTRYAYITIMIDTIKLQISVEELVLELKKLPKTVNVTILAQE